MNKVVLVTGSSRGIGKETILKFAKEGYDVIINYKDSKEEALSLQKEIISLYNVKSLTIKCDISKEEEVKNMLDFILANFNRIDILVNNASIARDNFFDLKTPSEFKEVLDVNVIGTFLVSRLIGNYMLKQGFGSIVNISSTNGIDTYYEESIDYDASKAAIISLTHNLAKHFSPTVRVNCVCPGWVDTDMNKNLDDNFKQKEIDKIMLKRFAKKEEIASSIYFVATESYLNNTILRVDGGYYGN